MFELEFLTEYLKDPTAQGAGLGFSIVFLYTLLRLFMPIITKIIGRKKEVEVKPATEENIDSKIRLQETRCNKVIEFNTQSVKDSFKDFKFNVREKLNDFEEKLDLKLDKFEITVESKVNGIHTEIAVLSSQIDSQLKQGEQKFEFYDKIINDSNELMKEIREKLK